MDDKVKVWYDHSAGIGGDIIEAVQVFERMSFFQSVERLSSSPPERIIAPKMKPKPVSKIKIDSIEGISHLALVDYIRKWGLEPKETAPFAKEVHWKNKGRVISQWVFSMSQSGGWVLRSSIFKGNILGIGISIQVIGDPKRIACRLGFGGIGGSRDKK